jgi:glutathione synthase/RimK-type ligase-like ATP-grasp enzyme
MNHLRLKHLRSKLIKYLTEIDRNGKLRHFLKKFIKEKPKPPDEIIDSAEPISFDWPHNVKKPFIGLVQERIHPYAAWPKYDRFLKHNEIPFENYQVHQSNFIEQAKKYDLIIWHTLSSFADQWEAKSKIEFLEKELKVFCFPSSTALWFYEDKVRQQWLFQENGIQAIDSFVSFSKEETLQYIQSCNYPIVSKEATNSASEGVSLLRNKKQATRFCHQVFGAGHKVHSSTYLRQKNYVIFQELIPNEGYDLRIIMIGNNYIGYYREVPKGDFRASGAGIFVKKNVPLDALYFAKSIKEKLPPTPYLSVDLLKNKIDDQYYVIEIAIFNRLRSSGLMVNNGVPGRFVYKNDQFIFVPGLVWPHDLVSVEIINSWIDAQRSAQKLPEDR